MIKKITQHKLPLLSASGVALFIAFVATLVLSGCKFYDNSTTFFNTYYNAKKNMNDAEEEFAYTREQVKPPKPRVVAMVEEGVVLEKKTGELPAYLQEFIVKPQELAPVAVKVDSIIIKGSKILAIHPKSNYIDGSLFLMGKAYFYRSEWLPANIKFQEMIEQFPESSFSPDAHLLSAKTYLIQRNIPKGKQMLSRTIDVAWQQKRYDILSEAFRLNAEVAIEEKDYDAAERPYRQAIAQGDDAEQQAKWQTDLGLVLYRLRKFAKAEKELDKVKNYDPTLWNDFEAKLYRASSLTHLERYSEANTILDELEKSRKYEDYLKMGYVAAERLKWLRIAGKTDSLEKYERYVDTAHSGSQSVFVANFERGMEFFRTKDYDKARRYFAKTRTTRSPVFDGSNTLYNLLNIRENKMLEVGNYEKKLASADTNIKRDSIKSLLARTLFEIGRTNDQLGNPDSAKKWYYEAVRHCPTSDTSRAQYLYVYARTIEPTSKEEADSLHEIIFRDYRTTQYGKEAKERLGYTDLAVVDTVADLYKSGSQLRKIGDYPFAIRQYMRVVEEYPKSNFAPRSLYSVGWIWERNLKNTDSARYYYSLLIKNYPTSEYADDVRYGVAYARAKAGDTTGGKPWERPVPKKDEKNEQKQPDNQMQNDPNLLKPLQGPKVNMNLAPPVVPAPQVADPQGAGKEQPQNVPPDAAPPGNAPVVKPVIPAGTPPVDSTKPVKKP